ncbi:hypothetical protein H1P_4600001 [Hyella patelloides LEGE 07179]|uniref:Uncharacterized protein n=1 Tax=Hyella patelloides LEGE 07179 TaxID=945734 RepID=A0A563VYR5_9CYAN|nr:hypothetical protein H1P_4600001 [Hyella patelloides LEGE 07179]
MSVTKNQIILKQFVQESFKFFCVTSPCVSSVTDFNATKLDILR